MLAGEDVASAVQHAHVREVAPRADAVALRFPLTTGHPGTTLATPYIPEAPPRGATPAGLDFWWLSLSPVQQHGMIEQHPERLGTLDGIPMTVRDTANRIVLQQQLKQLEADEPPAVVKPTSPMAYGFPAPNPAHAEWKSRMEALEQTRQALVDHPGLSLVLLRVDGTRVDVALAVGDVDTADHVGVYTQGLFSSTSDPEDIPAAVEEISDLDRLATQDLALDGKEGSTAMVMWMGYDAPQDFFSVLSESQAEEGAAGLASFADGIKAVNPGTSLVGVGHSYGSTVTGLAAQRTDAFDSLVAFGSPGLGTDDVKDLKVDTGSVYALRSPDDPVAGSGLFGGVPTSMPGVTVLSTAAAGDLAGPAAGPLPEVDPRSNLVGSLIDFLADLPAGLAQHNGYLAARTTAEHNIAAVVAGTPERIIG